MKREFKRERERERCSACKAECDCASRRGPARLFGSDRFLACRTGYWGSGSSSLFSTKTERPIGRYSTSSSTNGSRRARLGRDAARRSAPCGPPPRPTQCAHSVRDRTVTARELPKATRSFGRLRFDGWDWRRLQGVVQRPQRWIPDAAHLLHLSAGTRCAHKFRLCACGGRARGSLRSSCAGRCSRRRSGFQDS